MLSIMDISIIIPVYNEENNIILICNAIKSYFSNLYKQYELIFVNDGSNDGSLNILKDIQHKDISVRVISFDKNYGQTSALDAGFKAAEGKIILTIDADLQYDPRDLLRIIKELDNNDVDAVLGRRINRTSGFFKNTSSKAAIFVRNVLLREFYQDSSLAGYKKTAIKNLTLYAGTQVFIPTLLKMQGCRIKEINVKEYPRKHGKSKYNIRNRIFSGLFALFVVRWMKANKLKYKIV